MDQSLIQKVELLGSSTRKDALPQQQLDDGIGFYPGARSKSSLGLNIVEATVKEKLKGEFRISSGTGGTCAMIEFRRDLDRDAPV